MFICLICFWTTKICWSCICKYIKHFKIISPQPSHSKFSEMTLLTGLISTSRGISQWGFYYLLLTACSFFWRQHQVNHKKIVSVGEIVSVIIINTAASLQISQLGCCPWTSLFTVGSVFCSHEFWGPTGPPQSLNVLLMQLEHFNCYNNLFRVDLEWWSWCTVLIKLIR